MAELNPAQFARQPDGRPNLAHLGMLSGLAGQLADINKMQRVSDEGYDETFNERIWHLQQGQQKIKHAYFEEQRRKMNPTPVVPQQRRIDTSAGGLYTNDPFFQPATTPVKVEDPNQMMLPLQYNSTPQVDNTAIKEHIDKLIEEITKGREATIGAIKQLQDALTQAISDLTLTIANQQQYYNFDNDESEATYSDRQIQNIFEESGEVEYFSDSQS